ILPDFCDTAPLPGSFQWRPNGRNHMKARAWLIVLIASVPVGSPVSADGDRDRGKNDFLGDAQENAAQLIADGRRIFRQDTFGDETFWSGVLHLDQAVKTLSPSAALGLGLKVDVKQLPRDELEALEHGKVDLDDPKVTIALIRQNAVLGVVGFFDS